MTDYTPTTKQVRDGYRFDPEEDYYNPLQAGANAERAGRDFDRWLEQVKAEAWEEGKRAGLRQSDWEHGDTPTMYVAVNPYRKEQAEMNSDLAEAWDKGAETAWNRSTPEVNGTRYHWRHEGEPVNPYRQEKDA